MPERSPWLRPYGFELSPFVIRSCRYLGGRPGSAPDDRVRLTLDADAISVQSVETERELFQLPWSDVVGLRVESQQQFERRRPGAEGFDYMIVETAAGGEIELEELGHTPHELRQALAAFRRGEEAETQEAFDEHAFTQPVLHPVVSLSEGTWATGLTSLAITAPSLILFAVFSDIDSRTVLLFAGGALAALVFELVALGLSVFRPWRSPPQRVETMREAPPELPLEEAPATTQRGIARAGFLIAGVVFLLWGDSSEGVGLVVGTALSQLFAAKILRRWERAAGVRLVYRPGEWSWHSAILYRRTPVGSDELHSLAPTQDRGRSTN